MLEIFDDMRADSSCKINAEGREALAVSTRQMLGKENESFGNARTVRNIFERSIAFHANRIISTKRFREEGLSLLAKTAATAKHGTYYFLTFCSEVISEV